MWAVTAASYCPSRAGEVPKQNMTKSHERWDWKLCTVCEDAVVLVVVLLAKGDRVYQKGLSEVV